jgi:ribosome-binding protein aMBF1 (putative translation factor)
MGSFPLMARPTPTPEDFQHEWERRLWQAMQARTPKPWANKELSLAAGLNETFVRDALQLHRMPSIDNVTKLAKVLGVRPAWLAAYDDGEPQGQQ